MNTPVRAFMAARPYYSEGHVQEIAAFNAQNNVPFCRTCNDWHMSDEDHSDEN